MIISKLKPETVKAFLVTLLLALPMYSTWSSLVKEWLKLDQNLSHGFLVLFVFVYCLITQLKFVTQKHKTTKQNHFVILAFTISYVVTLLTHFLKIEVFTQIGFLTSLFFALCYTLPRVSPYSLLKVVGVLLFITQGWDYLNGILLSMSSAVVGFLVQSINITAYIEGNLISLPFGQLLIADGCSGLRYFTVSLALAWIMSILNNYNLKQTLIALCIAGTLGLITNWLRIFLLVLIAYYTDMESSLVKDHELFGWVLFSLISFIAMYFAPFYDQNKDKVDIRESQLNLIHLVPVIILVILSTLVTKIYFSLPLTTVDAGRTALISERLPKLPNELPINLDLKVNKNHGQIVNNPGEITFISVYSRTISRSDSEELVPYIGRLVDSTTFSIISKSVSVFEDKNVTELILENRYTQISYKVKYWFQVGRFNADSYRKAKLLQVPAGLLREGHFSLVVLQSKVTNNG